MQHAPLALIAAGGTGGHMFPAQALAEALLARGWRVILSTDARGVRYAGGFPQEVELYEVSAATPARGGLGARLLAPFRIAAGIVSALMALSKLRPDVVVGFGGYPSVPALSAAWALRLPRMLHEQNGVLGRVNWLFAPRVHATACGTWPVELPRRAAEPFHTGNPVRAAVLRHAGTSYIPPGDYPMSLLVIGGSQGARILADTVPAAVARLPDAIRRLLRVAQQARKEDIKRVRDAYAEAGVRAEVAPFFDDIPARLSDAQLVISRAGASSVADISVIGRPAILIPYAAAGGDHQSANARALVSSEAAILIPEARLDADVLAGQIAAVLSNPQAASRMAANALSCARPNATEALVEMVEALSARKRSA